MENFGKVIKKKREDKNWTQKQLADLLYVSPKSISRWERGNGYPDISLLPAISKILELDYQELLDGNEYVLRKREKKIRKIKILVITLICIVILAGMTILIPESKDYSSIKDLMINNNWSYIGFNDLENWYLLEEDQKNSLLDKLDIDKWQEVDMETYEKYTFIQNELANSIWYMIFSIDNHQIHIRYCEYENKNYISIQEGTNNEYELYTVSKPLDNPEKYIQEDMKQWYNFSNQHDIDNQSNDIKELSLKECELLLIEYSLNKEDFLTYDYLFIEDQHNERYYFILTSTSQDYQNINAQVNQGLLEIELTGEAHAYQKQYVHVFEINDMYEDISIKYNNEEISLLKVLHTLYEAKEIRRGN